MLIEEVLRKANFLAQNIRIRGTKGFYLLNISVALSTCDCYPNHKSTFSTTPNNYMKVRVCEDNFSNAKFHSLAWNKIVWKHAHVGTRFWLASSSTSAHPTAGLASMTAVLAHLSSETTCCL